MKKKDVEKLLLEAYKMGQESVSCIKSTHIGTIEYPGDEGNAEREMLRKLFNL